jgi:hypothetical protein
LISLLNNAATQVVDDAVKLTAAKEQQQANALMRLALALPMWRFREEELDLKKREMELKRLELQTRRLEKYRDQFYARMGHPQTSKLLEQIRQARTATHLAIPLLAESVEIARRYGVLTTRPGILGMAEAKFNELLASVSQLFGDEEAKRLARAMWVLRGMAAGLDLAVVRVPGAVLRIKDVESKILKNLEHAPEDYWVKLIEILTERFTTEEKQARTMLVGYLGQGIEELEQQAKALIDAQSPNYTLYMDWLAEMERAARGR